jgi:hypothetical protein
MQDKKILIGVIGSAFSWLMRVGLDKISLLLSILASGISIILLILSVIKEFIKLKNQLNKEDEDDDYETRD